MVAPEDEHSVSTLPQEKAPDGIVQSPLFVLGVPRSGTSLLYGLLNQHPQIALLYEGDLPLLWPLFLKHRSKADWLERWNFWSGAVERHQISVRGIPAGVSDIRSATEAAYRQYAGQKGATIWGCKSPNQYDSVDRLANLFPNARFLILWRDPVDVCRSMIRARTMTSPRFRQRGLVHRALLGCYQLARQSDRLKKRGALVHEIQYERLIEKPAEELPKICQFLNIDYDPRMESLQGADRSALPPGEHNALAAGDKIIGVREQPEVLPAQLKSKIDKYKNLWRARHPGWLLATYAEETSAKPSALVRIVDRILYRLLRTQDLAVVFVYCFLPLGLLQTYRILKSRYDTTWHDYGRSRRKRPWLEKS